MLRKLEASRGHASAEQRLMTWQSGGRSPIELSSALLATGRGSASGADEGHAEAFLACAGQAHGPHSVRRRLCSPACETGVCKPLRDCDDLWERRPSEGTGGALAHGCAQGQPGGVQIAASAKCMGRQGEGGGCMVLTWIPLRSAHASVNACRCSPAAGLLRGTHCQSEGAMHISAALE